MSNTENGAAHLAEQVSEKAKQQTQQVKAQAQQKVSQVWDAGRNQFHSVLTGQKDRAASGLGDVAQMLTQTAEQMKQQGQAGGGKIAETAAQRVQTMSDSIHEKEIEELLADTEQFARRQPATFLALAAFLGFILTRFLKSSGQAA